MDLGWLTLVPVVFAIVLIFITKNVIISLFISIISGGVILGFSGSDSLFCGLLSIVDVFGNPSHTKTILFGLLIGAFAFVVEASGGVDGLVIFFTEKKKIIRSPLGAQMLAYILGILLVIEADSSIIVSGITARPFCKKYKVSGAKLAYITDSTSRPIAWLFPLGAAGAFRTAMLETQIDAGIIDGNAFQYILAAIPFEIYCLVTLLLVGITIVTGKDFKSMSKIIQQDLVKSTIPQNRESQNTEQHRLTESLSQLPKGKVGNPLNIVLPIIVLISSIFILLGIFGKAGVKGGNTSAVFLGGLITHIFCALFYWIQKIASPKHYLKWFFKGAGRYLKVVTVFTLALAMGGLLAKLGTGAFLVSLTDGKGANLIPVSFFLLSAILSFATGTSGGTFAITLPIVIPIAVMMNLHIPLVLGAVISGGVLGDHSSPLSGSTILSAAIAEVDVITHFKTQLPYVIICGTISFAGFLILGFIF